MRLRSSRLLLFLLLRKVLTLMSIMGLGSIAAVTPAYAQRGDISGIIVEGEKAMPLAGAHAYLVDLGVGAVSRRDGKFQIKRVPHGAHRLVVRYIGYATRELTLDLHADTAVRIHLEPTSFAMKDVVVSGRKVRKAGSSMQIGQEALAYIQPNSVADVMQFLPGALASDGKLTGVQSVSLRQGGEDANTQLGTAILIDGVPMSNNANLGTLGADSKIRENATVNGGLDLRMLSTDHFQGVQVERGIASARYGDLTSGAIELRPKQGVMPWQSRLKADPLTKTAYVGKGFALPLGALHAGIEYTAATPDERELLQAYRRYSGQLNWTTNGRMGSIPVETGVRAAYIGTLQYDRFDPDLVKQGEDYRVNYSRYQLALKGKLLLGLPWLNSLRMTLSADYTHDLLRRTAIVSGRPMAMPLRKDTGKGEGVYLPQEYFSAYRLENEPLGLFGVLEGKTCLSFWGMAHTLSYGGELRVAKNLGRGYIYDINTPPAPGASTSSRPRVYSDIPAYLPLSFYLEDRVGASGGWGDVELVAGLRLSQLLNLDGMYADLRKPSLSPRLNGYYGLPSWGVENMPVKLGIRAGYGQQAKWPTLDMVAPPTAYFDYMEVDYYSQVVENRYLYIATFVEDARNGKLQSAKVTKYEAGLDIGIGDAKLELTYFREDMDNGFTYRTHYLPFRYTKYDNASWTGGGKPNINGMTGEEAQRLAELPRPTNGLSTLKRGLEYRLRLPKWQLLMTKLELSGAWFKTEYNTSEPVEYHPSHSIKNGQPFPYVGIYAFDRGRERSMLNSTLWLHTHIPALRLFFSTMVQGIWFTESRALPHGGTPLEYRSVDGAVHPWQVQDAQDPELQFLVRKFSENYWSPYRVPWEITINLKASKELGKHTRVSLFANRLLGIMPDYRDNLGLLRHRTYSPFFGAEITVKL